MKITLTGPALQAFLTDNPEVAVEIRAAILKEAVTKVAVFKANETVAAAARAATIEATDAARKAVEEQIGKTSWGGGVVLGEEVKKSIAAHVGAQVRNQLHATIEAAAELAIQDRLGTEGSLEARIAKAVERQIDVKINEIVKDQVQARLKKVLEG